MVFDLVFYQLVLIALVWLCLILHGAWPNDPVACPTTPEFSSPLPKRTRKPQPFAGLIPKPPCDACKHATHLRPQAPAAPPPRIVPMLERCRPVATATHFWGFLPNHVHAELGMHMKMPATRYRRLDTVAHGAFRYAKIKDQNLRDIYLVNGNDLRLGGRVFVEQGQLMVYLVIIAEEIHGSAIHQVQQDMGALHMAQKVVAKADASVSALSESREVHHDEGLIVPLHDVQHRLQCGARVGGYLGLCSTDGQPAAGTDSQRWRSGPYPAASATSGHASPGVHPKPDRT